MRPLRLFPLLAAFLPYFAMAQVDTLRDAKGVCFPAAIHSVSDNALRAQLLHRPSEKTSTIPFASLSSLRFADGFELHFQNGLLVRDNLLSAPMFRSTLWGIQAEDVIPLNQEEIRRLYGDRLYYLDYRPFRSQFLTGLGKLGGGIAGLFVTRKWLDPTIWRQGYFEESYYSKDGSTTRRVEFSVGDLYPGWMAVETLFMGAVVAGVLDCSVTAIGLKRLLRRHETMDGPSLGGTKTFFWSGVALSAVGAGAITACALHLNAHPQWNYQVHYSQGKVTKEVREGEPASLNVAFGLIGGAIVLNLGLSAIQMSQTRLSGFRKLDGTPYSMQMDLGPAPSGYGVTLRF